MAVIETFMSLASAGGVDMESPRPRANFDAASRSHRTRNWKASPTGQNTLLLTDLATIRDRSRAAIRNNPNAAAAKDSLTANAIGSGIRPISLHPDKRVRQKIHEEWGRFVEEMDFDDRTDGYGLQALAFGAMFENGECFARLRINENKRSKLEIQLIDPAQIPMYDLSVSPADGNDVFQGVEFNPEGKRVAYHMLPYHPEEMYPARRSMSHIRVPVSEMIHLARMDAIGQIRGIPWLSAVLLTLHELDQYMDAALVMKKISRMYLGFIKSGEASDPMPSTGPVESKPTNTEGIDLEPGTIATLMPGEDLTWSTPPEEKDFEPFVAAQLHRIAVGAGLTYHHLTGDLSRVSFSSIRSGLDEFKRRCSQKQFSIFIPQFCRPIFKRWMDLAVLAGVLPFSSDYATNKVLYQGVEWMPEGWPYVDPLKDVNAQILSIKNRLSSRALVINERGYDKEQIDRENKNDDQLQYVDGTDTVAAAMLLANDDKEESRVIQ